MIKERFTIFFSWHSNNSKENKHIIMGCLEKISETLKKECSYEVVIDEGTNKTFGSPLITATIFNKIDKCNIFVCDVSNINSTITNSSDIRSIPNPNVMIELGYAINLLGWERIICINNLKFGELEKLPFDIRGNRISKYDSSKERFKSDLETTLKTAVKAILDNYETILDNHNSNENKSHDRDIATKFLDICSEQILFDSIGGAKDNMRVTQINYGLWQKYEHFYKDSINWFINANLDCMVKVFIQNLSVFESKCSIIFHWNADFQYSDENKDRVYRFPENPHRDESWGERSKRYNSEQLELVKLYEAVKKSYQMVILSIKKNGLC